MSNQTVDTEREIFKAQKWLGEALKTVEAGKPADLEQVMKWKQRINMMPVVQSFEKERETLLNQVNRMENDCNLLNEIAGFYDVSEQLRIGVREIYSKLGAKKQNPGSFVPELLERYSLERTIAAFTSLKNAKRKLFRKYGGNPILDKRLPTLKDAKQALGIYFNGLQDDAKRLVSAFEQGQSQLESITKSTKTIPSLADMIDKAAKEGISSASNMRKRGLECKLSTLRTFLEREMPNEYVYEASLKERLIEYADFKFPVIRKNASDQFSDDISLQAILGCLLEYHEVVALAEKGLATLYADFEKNLQMPEQVQLKETNLKQAKSKAAGARASLEEELDFSEGKTKFAKLLLKDLDQMQGLIEARHQKYVEKISNVSDLLVKMYFKGFDDKMEELRQLVLKKDYRGANQIISKQQTIADMLIVNKNLEESQKIRLGYLNRLPDHITNIRNSDENYRVLQTNITGILGANKAIWPRLSNQERIQFYTYEISRIFRLLEDLAGIKTTGSYVTISSKVPGSELYGENDILNLRQQQRAKIDAKVNEAKATLEQNVLRMLSAESKPIENRCDQLVQPGIELEQYFELVSTHYLMEWAGSLTYFESEYRRAVDVLSESTRKVVDKTITELSEKVHQAAMVFPEKVKEAYASQPELNQMAQEMLRNLKFDDDYHTTMKEVKRRVRFGEKVLLLASNTGIPVPGRLKEKISNLFNEVMWVENIQTKLVEFARFWKENQHDSYFRNHMGKFEFDEYRRSLSRAIDLLPDLANCRPAVEELLIQHQQNLASIAQEMSYMYSPRQWTKTPQVANTGLD
ncbi:MAG: hypothetical protein V1837_05095 [Candidatus Woesearchaeota archaeon]